MAEFQEVARHWKRMCKKYWTAISCHGCPIAEHEHGYEACSAYEADVVKMEELVMLWAAEHPAPKYPTWMEYLFTIYDTVWPQIATMEIPADIAEKLGIEPKER